MRQVGRWAAITASAGALGAGCLPADDRPEPASVYLGVAAGPVLRDGFATSDGWSVHFDRVVAGLGNLHLDGDPNGSRSSCNAYSDPRYDRTFDFAVPAEPYKVGIVYGLGACSVTWRVRSPSFDTLRGPGVSVADVEAMRIPASDAYTVGNRVVLFVEGSAARAGLEKRFAWAFRRSFKLDRCPDGGGAMTTVRGLESGDDLAFEVEVRPEELFRRAPDDAEPLVFERYAAADADADGLVTLDELVLVDLPEGDPWPEDPNTAIGPNPPSTRPKMLAELVYGYLLARVTRLQGGGACHAEARG